MSGKPQSPENQARQLIVAYQQYQAEAESLVRELGLIQMTAEGLDRAISAIGALSKAAEGQEMLVPIGSGSFAYAKLSSKDKVVVNVGGGVSMEKPAGEAMEMLRARRNAISESSKKINEALAKIEQEMARIQAALERLERELQKQGGSEGFVQ
ncbi:MAG: prefoldin subunit alpha [Methanothrix sp.]|uniref:prefoldin subunit alpha n=1 Tax=Methanothrix sp. TaxID=90426 RepID=UPI00247DB9A6|nr:prefoldin subunit alpha [Methanothrix sp.]